ncbi:hypothetical protein BH09PSE5_BH09PSE5_13570 [soil metagenome]
MALTGTAFLALFNGFDPARDDEYNRWHSGEHVPERLTVPGITSSRRYVGRDEALYTYFTLYEMASPDTMLSQPYLDLMKHPTPWTAAMRSGFRNFYRVPCATLASVGDGVGGALKIFVLSGNVGDDKAVASADWLALAAALTATTGCVAAHIGLEDTRLPGPPGLGAASAEPVPTVAVLVEAQEARALHERSEQLSTLLRQGAPSWHVAGSHEYVLMHLLNEQPPKPVEQQKRPAA